MKLKFIYTFAISLAKQMFYLLVNESSSFFLKFKIIYLPGLHSCSTLGGFSHFKGYGV